MLETLAAIVVFSLLTWRLTMLAIYDKLPGNLAVRIRGRMGVYYDEFSNCQGRNWIAQALCCPWCTSIWIGWLVALAWQRDWNFIWLGLVLSAGTLIIDRLVRNA